MTESNLEQKPGEEKSVDTEPVNSSSETAADSSTPPSIASRTAGENKTDAAPTSSSPPLRNPDAAKPAAEPEAHRTRLETTLIMVSLCSALFLAALDVTIVTVAIPTITEEFQSTTGYAWIGSAYMLASSSGAPMWGKISDIWGRKPLLLLAVGIFWVGSVLSATSVNMTMLIVARAIQGVGSGGIIILVNICISDLFSMRKRGTYFGAMGMVWAVAGGIGPIIGGAFTSRVSWRWCFYINLPISGAGFAILVFVLKLHNPRTPMKQGLAAVDWLGTVTIVGGTLMFLLGLELGGVTYPWNSPTVICLIVFGLVVAAIFVVIEWKVAKYPIIPMRVFTNRSNAAAFTVSAVHGFVFISGSYYLPLYFQAVLGASPLLSGTYVLPFTLVLALVSAATGIFIRKTGQYLPCIIFGMFFMTLGFGLFLDLEPQANWARIVIFQILAGIGTGPNFQSPLIALQTTVAPRDIASVTGTFGFIRQLFTAISIVIGGVVFQNSMQRQYPQLLATLGPDLANLLSGANAGASVGVVAALPGAKGDVARAAYWTSLRTMYIMYVGFAGLGLAASFLVRPRKLSKEHQEHKTGLKGMEEGRREREAAKRNEKEKGGGGVVDEEKAAGLRESAELGSGAGVEEEVQGSKEA